MKLRYFLPVSVGISVFLFLGGCGPLQENLGKASQPLSVQFVLPDKVESELFWSGVVQKEFIWTETGEAEKRFRFEEIATITEDFSGPGILSFEARNAGGVLLVYGRAEIHKQKQVLLPLERVIY